MKLYTPANTLIAFDFHEVIVTPDYGQLFWYAINYLPKKWLVIYGIWPLFWIRLIKTRRRTRVPEVMYNIMCSYYPRLELIRSHFIAMSNMQLLRSDVVKLIQELKKQGYSIYLFSNIGPQTLADIRTKLPLDELIDNYYTPQEKDSFAHKPQEVFYHAFKKTLKKQQPHIENIIFIDDKRKNINAGSKADLLVIHFMNAQQTRQTLMDLLEAKTI